LELRNLINTFAAHFVLMNKVEFTIWQTEFNINIFLVRLIISKDGKKTFLSLFNVSHKKNLGSFRLLDLLESGNQAW
jgi:hypothetical protein